MIRGVKDPEMVSVGDVGPEYQSDPAPRWTSIKSCASLSYVAGEGRRMDATIEIGEVCAEDGREDVEQRGIGIDSAVLLPCAGESSNAGLPGPLLCTTGDALLVQLPALETIRTGTDCDELGRSRRR